MLSKVPDVPASIVAWTVIVAEALGASVPMFAVRLLPLRVAVPTVELAEVKIGVSSVGRASVNDTPVAVDGPLLVTTIT